MYAWLLRQTRYFSLSLSFSLVCLKTRFSPPLLSRTLQHTNIQHSNPGAPTDEPKTDALIEAYAQRQGVKGKKRTPLQSLRKLALIICSDNEKDVKYMNKLDIKLYDTDVVDDWFEEMVQIMEVYFRVQLVFSVAERYPWGKYSLPCPPRLLLTWPLLSNHLAKMLLGKM